MIKKAQIIQLPYPKHFESYSVWNGLLGVKVTRNRKKFFLMKESQNSEVSSIKCIGVFPDMPVEEAARIVSSRSKEPRTGTLIELLNEFHLHKASIGMRTTKHVMRQLDKELTGKIDLKKHANLVTSSELSELIGQAIQRGASVYSNRLRSYLHSLFNFGLQFDLNPANKASPFLFRLEKNPVARIPLQKYAEKPRERWLTLTELKFVLKITKATSTGNLIRFCLYSGGQRPFEILHSEKSNVDLKSKDWFFPSGITKNKVSHSIPITPELEQLLKLAISDSPFLFPSKKKADLPQSTGSFTQAIRRLCIKHNITYFTPRDLRRTCKTLMARYQMGTKEIRDRIHNHSLNDISSKHYNWYDYRKEKRRLLNQWSKCISKLE